MVDEEFGQELQDAGVKTVIVDNGRKAHSKMVQDAWATFDIKVWSDARYVSDRKLISQFTDEDEAKLSEFTANSTDCKINGQSVNYDTFNRRKPSRKINGGFINDIKSSFGNLSQ